MWLNELKIAVATEDVSLLGKLLADIPELESKKEMQSAIILFSQAKELLEAKKMETEVSMQQIKKNINFLKSGVADTPAKFDITS
jgi:glutaminase